MKKVFEMTDLELKEIMDASKPTPVMYLSGGQPMFNSRQANANHAWRLLGEKYGFDHMTVRPTGKGVKFFSAMCITKE